MSGCAGVCACVCVCVVRVCVCVCVLCMCNLVSTCLIVHSECDCPSFHVCSLGSLSTALAMFNAHHINLSRIESRPSKRSTDYEFYVDFNGSPSDENVKQLLKELRMTCRNVQIVQSKKGQRTNTAYMYS